MVLCRKRQIEQVLLNLLTNARFALNERFPGYHHDKLLKIESLVVEEVGKTWVRTIVEDHGSGIPLEAQDRIFDPFFTTKRAGLGSGLGLSVCQGIVEDHKGRLWVESNAGATRFYLDLPPYPKVETS
jgi:signal transduction histidine kinase